MTFRLRLLVTLVVLASRIDCAAGASTVDHRFAVPITVALVPTDVFRDRKDTLALIPEGALDRAATWIKQRGLQGYNTSTETNLFADTADGFLDEHGLIEAALIAEGIVDQRERSVRLEKFEAVFQELRIRIDASSSEAERADALLGFLHRTLFVGGYRVDCTQLSEVLIGGQFNCASATIVFCAFAERLGMETVAIEVPGHVLCGLSVGNDRIDVETTCPRWLSSPDRDVPRNRFVYNAKSASEIGEHSPRVLGIDRPTATAQRSELSRQRETRHDGPTHGSPVAWRQEMPTAALVAIVYYNRGLDELGRQKFAAAAVANVNALRINPRSPAAWSNLLATVNNWALAANQQGNYAQAIALLQEGIKLAPNHALFQANLKAVYQRQQNANPVTPNG